MNDKTLLYQVTETSKYMMAFVLVTREDNVIVIDGGRPEDMPLLKEVIGGRHISGWFLTHPHSDHISGLLDELEKNGGADFDIGAFYYNFPPYSLIDTPDVPDRAYFEEEYNEMLPAFERLMPAYSEKCHILRQGETFMIDECKIEVLYTWHEGLVSNPMNDASSVFRISGPNKNVLFLGDLGPDAGDILFRESRELLRSDMVQMAHHGHMNIGMEVYAAIAPEACFWCCPDWLYNEPVIPEYLSNTEKLMKMKRIRMYGTALTRQWMDILGVKTHYVTAYGTNCVEL